MFNDFSKFITEPYKSQESNINESVIIGALFASACLMYATAPVFTAAIDAHKEKKNRNRNDGGGMSFWDFLEKRSEKRQQKKEAKKRQEIEKQNNETFNSLLMIAKKSNKNEKDENDKKKNDAIIKILTACSFDKDGNEIPVEERINKMKDHMSKEQFKSFKKEALETYEKKKNDKDFKDALSKAKASIKPEEYDKMLEEAKKEAKTTLEQLEKEKQEIKEYEKKLQSIEDEIDGGDEKDKEIRKLKKQLEELKNNPPQTLATTASGVPVGDTPSNTSDGEKKNKDGYIEKEETVKDPKTGEKMKVKTYTGPRGGKFYYPDGKPKKPENKVYVQESNSLTDYLLESIE